MSKKILSLVSVISFLVLVGASCVSTGGNNNKGPAGMFISKDGGDTWKQISSMPTASGSKDLSKVSVYRLRSDPQDPDAIYWASRNSGLFYSYDAGNSWKQANETSFKGFIYDVVVHPKDKCLIYVTNGRQIFKSVDCNRTWQEVFKEVRDEVSIRTLAINYFGKNEIFAGESNGNLLKSEDDGASWTKMKNFGSNILALEFDKNKEGLFYLGTKTKGLYRSNDSGINWVSLNSKLKKYAGALEFRRFYIYPTNSDQIYWISKYGILYSKNSGEDWDAMKLVTPPGSVFIYGFGVNPKNEKDIYYTAYSQNFSNFYRSNDGGKSWTTKKLPTKQTPVVMYVHPQKEGTIFLGFTIIEKK